MQVFEIIFPIFAITLLGYGLARTKLFGKREVDGLFNFVFYLAIPAMLYTAISTMEIESGLDWRYFASYYGAASIVFVIAILIGIRWFNHKKPEQAIYGMAASYPNMMLVSLPILAGAMGEKALVPLFALVSVDNAIYFTVVTLYAERESGGARFRWDVLGASIRSVITNPIVIALVLGVIANLVNFTLPGILSDVVSTLGDATLPVALFVLGASLTEYRITGDLPQVSVIVALKMLVMPVLVFTFTHLVFDLDPLWAVVGTIVAGMPVGISPTLFAKKYDALVPTIGAAVLISSLLTVVSAWVLLSIFV